MILKRTLSIASGVIALLFTSTQVVAASSFYNTGSLGVDVSYPNCSATIPTVSYGIVGVNNGLVYGHNGCAVAEASHFSNLSLYANTGLNASTGSSYYTQAKATCNGDISCAAYTYGYNAGVDAMTYANSQGIHSAKWWLDVETSNTWNADTIQNQRSIQGEYDALIAGGATMVGVYSTTAQWQSITNGWRNNWPSWGATTWTSSTQAQTYCTGHQFTGGPSLLMQYKSKQSKIDQDVAC